jgi:hypothetical protein
MNQERELSQPPLRMSEAEVSLGLAFWLIRKKYVSDDEPVVFVAIHRVQADVGRAGAFDVARFLYENHWQKADSTPGWPGTYRHSEVTARLVIGPAPGPGDVVCRLKDGRVLRVEAKKGPLTTSKSSDEYALIREALAQLLTLPVVRKHHVLAVAVPYSPKFEELARRWRDRPLIKRLGILIFTVGRDGDVDPLSAWSFENSIKHHENTATMSVLDGMVKDALSRAETAVAGKDYPGYTDFLRQALRVMLRWSSGGTCDLAMTQLVGKWTGRGCAQELLLLIAQDYLGWVPPGNRPVSPSRVQPGPAPLNTGLPASTRRSSKLR